MMTYVEVKVTIQTRDLRKGRTSGGVDDSGEGTGREEKEEEGEEQRVKEK